MSKIYMFGNGLARSIFNNCKLLQPLIKSNTLFISPISIGSHKLNAAKHISDASNESLTDLQKLENSIKNKKEDDYIVIDLDSVALALTLKKGIYSTFYATGNGETPSRTIDTDYKLYENEFFSFIGIIKEKFDDKHIILIASQLPVAMTDGKNIIPTPVNQQNYIELHNSCVNYFEKLFLSKTNCIYLDYIHYFLSRSTYENYAPYNLESFFYLSIEKAIIDISNNNSIDCCKIPLLYTIERYTTFNYDSNAINLFPPMQLISLKDCLGQFLILLSPQYVLKYKDVLLLIEKNNPHSVDDVISFVRSFNCIAEFKQIAECIYQIITENINVYDLVQTDINSYAFLNLDHKKIGKFFNQNKLFTNSRIVTEYNSIYYLYLKQLITKTNLAPSVDVLNDVLQKNSKDLELLKNKFNLVVDPLQVDIWGSCFSRLIIFFRPDIITCNKYLFQVDPLTSLSEPVKYPQNIFIEPLSVDDKMTKIQLDGSAYEFLKGTTSKWLIVDFYTLLGNRQYYYEGKGYYNHPTPNTRKLSPVLSIQHYKLGHREFIENRLLLFIKKIKELYGNNIIYIDCKFTKHYIDENGMIKHFINDSLLENYSQNKKFFDSCKNFFLKNIDCYYVDLSNFFFGFGNSFVGLSPSHFEKAMYIEESKIIEKIITKHPTQKIYNHLYNGELIIDRYISLLKNGNNKDLILESIPYVEIKNILEKSTLEEVIANRENLINLINNMQKS